MADALRRREAGRRVIDLSDTNFHSHGVRYPDESLARFFREYVQARGYLPDARGRNETRSEIARWYAAQGVQLDAERIFLTASTSESYALLFQALAEAGNRVLLPSPTYPLFEQLCRYARLEPDYYNLDSEACFAVDFDSVERGLANKPAFAVTISPNNPTGAVMSAGERAYFARLCAHAHVPLIEDEVFRSFEWHRNETDSHTPPDTDGRDMNEPATTEGLRFKLGGASKLLAAPDLKLAWIAMQGRDPSGTVEERLELAVDTYLNASAPSQFVVGGMLSEGAAYRQRIREQLYSRVRLADRLLFGDESGDAAGKQAIRREAAGAPRGEARIYPQAGGVHRVIQVPGADDECLARSLLGTHGVLVHPGYFYGFPDDGYLIVSTVSDETTLTEGIQKLLHFLELR